MAAGKKNKEAAAPTQGRRAKEKSRVVQDIIHKVETKLQEQVEKATLGDYLKLIQLEKELDEENPPALKVQWVETEETKSESD